jgi:hypothetical protein
MISLYKSRLDKNRFIERNPFTQNKYHIYKNKMSDHQVGTTMKYRDLDGIKKFLVLRKSETEYEYDRKGNSSLWKNMDVRFVIKENGDMWLQAYKKDGRCWNCIQIYRFD